MTLFERGNLWQRERIVTLSLTFFGDEAVWTMKVSEPTLFVECLQLNYKTAFVKLPKHSKPVEPNTRPECQRMPNAYCLMLGSWGVLVGEPLG